MQIVFSRARGVAVVAENTIAEITKKYKPQLDELQSQIKQLQDQLTMADPNEKDSMRSQIADLRARKAKLILQRDAEREQVRQQRSETSGAYTKFRLTRPDVASIAKQLFPIIRRHSTESFLAGSYRRGATDIGDMDFIVTDCDLAALVEGIGEKFEVKKVARSGASTTTLVLHLSEKSEAQVEFVNVPDRSVGAALLHSTGSGEFNVGLRTYARQKGYLLNQYGLFKNGRYVVGKSEESIFNRLGLKFIPPNQRNGSFWDVKSKFKIKD